MSAWRDIARDPDAEADPGPFVRLKGPAERIEARTVVDAGDRALLRQLDALNDALDRTPAASPDLAYLDARAWFARIDAGLEVEEDITQLARRLMGRWGWVRREPVAVVTVTGALVDHRNAIARRKGT